MQSEAFHREQPGRVVPLHGSPSLRAFIRLQPDRETRKMSAEQRSLPRPGPNAIRATGATSGNDRERRGSIGREGSGQRRPTRFRARVRPGFYNQKSRRIRALSRQNCRGADPLSSAARPEARTRMGCRSQEEGDCRPDFRQPGASPGPGLTPLFPRLAAAGGGGFLVFDGKELVAAGDVEHAVRGDRARIDGAAREPDSPPPRSTTSPLFRLRPGSMVPSG